MKAVRKFAEFAMCRACKQQLDPPILQRIIDNWLNLFKDPKDSDLDLDVEKFSSLGEKTGLVYQIAFQIYQKVMIVVIQKLDIRNPEEQPFVCDRSGREVYTVGI